MILLIDLVIEGNKCMGTYLYCMFQRTYLLYNHILWFFIAIYTKPDAFIYQYFILRWENSAYNYHFLHQLPPKFVYSSNFRYNNIYSCRICLESFDGPLYGIEAILICGHRFHSQCIRKWELIQFSKNPYNDYYLCPLCKKDYNWKTKYNYIYTINHHHGNCT